MDTENNKKPMSAEEMARLIAQNLNKAEKEEFGSVSDDHEEYDDNGYEDEYDNEDEGYSVKTAARPRKKTRVSYDETPARKRKKKKSAGVKAAAFMCAFIAIVALAAGSYYLVGMNNRKGVFLDNTYINGINVSGKTEAEAYKLLTENKAANDTIIIEKLDGTEEEIKFSELGYVDDTKARVSQYYSQQNHYAWFSAQFTRTDFNWTNEFEYDKAKLKDIISARIVKSKEVKTPKNAKIVKTDDGTYTVTKETAGTKINPSKAKTLYEYIEKQVDSGNYKIDISDVDCYQKASVTAAKLQPTCDTLNSLSSMEISIDFNYTKEKLSGSRIMDWVTLSKDGASYEVDEDAAMTYVEELADKYDTYDKERKFKSTKRGVVTIPKTPEGSGCYGWWIDQEQTRDLIVETVENGKSADIEPVYFVNPDSQYSYTCKPEWRSKDKDYSNTYVEVDLTAQHLWYYKDGKKVMETPIVSGYDGDPERKTPPGVYKVWIKEKDAVLRGSSGGVSYASPVDYWNNISTIGIGLHDASWQNGDFNSEKYHTSTWGSHGCINMPWDKAKYVYENIDYDTPVFIYY